MDSGKGRHNLENTIFVMPFSSTNSKIFNKQTQQPLVTSQQLLLNNLSFNLLINQYVFGQNDCFDYRTKKLYKFIRH
ncbi:hypothetical protein RI543_001863 [Arxiozyma heterogenica]|uniref:Uncharacterized protein n=1 Tax=Arxiozyma heterogenica TaxID=278026 RepID=A0AAN7W426_9SACH|nr:hypothetical protein RI543_001863 [Kazachstania heterogenica]